MCFCMWSRMSFSNAARTPLSASWRFHLSRRPWATVSRCRLSDGEKTLDIPKGTQPGDIFTFPGEGITSLRTRRRGDQIIQVDVKTPTRLNKKQEGLLREFAKLEKNKFSNKLKSLLKKRSA